MKQIFNRVLLVAAFLAGASAFGQSGEPISLKLNPTSVQAGLSSTGTISVKIPLQAPDVIAVHSDNANATVPATVTIPSGQTQATFTITTSSASPNSTANIKATTVEGDTSTQSLSIVVVAVSSVSINPSKGGVGYVNVGSTATGTVTLAAGAPGSGAYVPLSVSPTACATVPATAFVASGASTGTFTITGVAPCATGSVSSLTASAPLEVTANPTVTIVPSLIVGGLGATGTFSVSQNVIGSLTVNLAASDKNLQIPASVTIPSGQSSVQFSVTSTPVTASDSVTVSASDTVFSVSTVESLVVVGVKSIALNPSSVAGGLTSSATVNLSAPAPTGGVTVALSSSNTSLATLPATVAIAAGASSAVVQVQTTATTAGGSATIQGTLNNTSTSSLLTILAESIKSLVLSPSSVAGGGSSKATLTLLGPAPTGGITANLTSSSSYAKVPASVSIAAGASSADFEVLTTSPTANGQATITAKYLTASLSATLSILAVVPQSLTLNPTSVIGGTGSTATLTLTQPAPGFGVTATIASSTKSISAPSTVYFPLGATQETFQLTTSAVASNTSGTITATVSAAPITATLSVVSPVLQSITLNPTSVAGGYLSTATVTLSGPAPTGGIQITLASTSSFATVPKSVTVPAGSATTTFSVTTTPATTNVQAVISATFQAVKVTSTLSIIGLVPTSLTVSPTSVIGGSPSTATLTLNQAAPSGGVSVVISSDSSFAIVPTTVTVAAGSSGATFQVTTTSVTKSGNATIKATLSGTSQSAVLAVTAAALQSISLSPSELIGGASSTGTVTLTGPAPVGGASVALSSNSKIATLASPVIVPAGATSVTFPVATTTASSVQKAVVSGVLGAVTQTATLTVDPIEAKSLTINPASLVGGTTATATLTLNGPAPTGGVVATLSSSSSAFAKVPSSVTIAAGATSATFKIITELTTTSVNVTITAVAGDTVTAPLAVNPKYTFNFPSFPNSNNLTLNGNAYLSNPTITLTDYNDYEASSGFYDTPVNVSNFQCQFEFMMTDAEADGLTFCITTNGPTSLGAYGGYIGYEGIPNSVAIKFDLWNNVGDDANSTGIFFNGAAPFDPSIRLSPVYLASGDKMRVQMTYASNSLKVVTTDEATGQKSTQTYSVNIPASIGNQLAYVGFTGGTGAATSLTRMYSWWFIQG